MSTRKSVPISAVAVGDKLIAGEHHTCLAFGQICEVKLSCDGSLYVECAKGIHILDGQIGCRALGEDPETYVGFSNQ